MNKLIPTYIIFVLFFNVLAFTGYTQLREHHSTDSDIYKERIKRAEKRCETAMQRAKIAVLRIYAESQEKNDSLLKAVKHFSTTLQSKPHSCTHVSDCVLKAYNDCREIAQIKEVVAAYQLHLQIKRPKSIGVPYFAKNVIKILPDPTIKDITFKKASLYIDKAAFIMEQHAQYIEVVAEQFVTRSEIKKKVK
ncbi:hypothetical protein [Ascidiimonas aurantiaca]|uniref:hypothetical protein n=1 Tax=Ascidiimonas aurantiaca TaxID=1685432 RepID=UPI0030ED3321